MKQWQISVCLKVTNISDLVSAAEIKQILVIDVYFFHIFGEVSVISVIFFRLLCGCDTIN
jgi:hypothetical protein